MKCLLVSTIIFFVANARAITSVKEIKDMADEAVAASYTAEALVDLLEELELSEESRRKEYISMLETAKQIRDEMDELNYANDELEDILGPVFNPRSIEQHIRQITARVKKIKSFRNRAIKLLSLAGKASNDAVLANETNQILREIQNEQMRSRIDADRSRLHSIKIESAKKIKRKRYVNALWKSVETDSRKRKIPPASPIIFEKRVETKHD